jgi:putative two-component system response regulator
MIGTEVMTAIASQYPILIVEDHADTAEMLRRYLARRGLAVDVAGSGSEALRFLADKKPSCMILDETMPGMSGLDLLRRIQAEPEHRDIPVFFYSAAFEQRKQAEAATLGAKGWFIKGISRLDDLMQQIIQQCSAARPNTDAN